MSSLTPEVNANDTARALAGLLPTLTAKAARLARLTAKPHFVQRLANQAQLQALHILPHAERAQATPSWGMLEVHHPLGQAQVLFDLAPWPMLQILAADPSSETTDADSMLCAAALDIFLSDAAQRLQDLGLSDLRFHSLTPCHHAKTSASAPQERITLRFQLAQQKQATPVTLTLNHIDTSLLGAFEELLLDESPSLSQRWAPLRIPGRVLLGVQRLPIEALYSLREEDMLLGGVAPHYHSLLNPFAELDELELLWGTPNGKRLRSIGKLEGQMIVIKDMPMISEDNDSEAMLASRDDEIELNHLAQLDVPVRLEIDTVMLPLAQLAELGPGYVMELPTPLAQATIRLTVHGQTVGFGELVAVGEHLAIRIKKMAPIDAATH